MTGTNATRAAEWAARDLAQPGIAIAEQHAQGNAISAELERDVYAPTTKSRWHCRPPP